MGYVEDFEKIYKTEISRAGCDKLFDWIKTTDFFTAPASTKFHCACPGGLVQHSVMVYNVLMSKHFNEQTDSKESFTVCALLHDLCKANFYKISTRNVKNDKTGAWEKQPFYSVEDQFPYGHGEKSVFLIERFMRLKPAEAVAIRWHMGGFDDAAKSAGFAISNAFDKYPLAVKLHISDLESTFLNEQGTSVVNKK